MKGKILIIILLFFSLAAGTTFPQTKKVAVTFDDLPLNIALKVNNEEMEKIVEKLIEKIKSENIPVTAFVNENKLKTNGKVDPKRVEILKMWINAGIELGNHTYSHKGAHNVSVDEYKEDILNGERILHQILDGKPIRYFRHPFLHTGLTPEYKNEVGNFLTKRGYKIAPVTFDNSEWIFSLAYDKSFTAGDSIKMKKIAGSYIEYMRNNIRYFENQTQKLFNKQINQILLLHSNRINSDYFDELYNMIHEEGYEFISLEEALKDEAYNTEDTFTGNNGISWLHRWAYTQDKQKDFFEGEPKTPSEVLIIAGLESQ